MKRIELLDVCRSFLLLAMAAFHFIYDMSLFGAVSPELVSGTGAKIYAYYVGGGFILISGMLCRISREPVRRGFIIFCWGLLVSAVMAAMGLPVYFGILQLIGSAMMLTGWQRERLISCDGPAFPAVCLCLFILSALVTGMVFTSRDWLSFLGLHSRDFFSADYYPLLPWSFIYLLGFWLGGRMKKNRALLERTFPPALTLPGRHSLAVYLIHQPLLYGLCRLLFGR